MRENKRKKTERFNKKNSNIFDVPFFALVAAHVIEDVRSFDREKKKKSKLPHNVFHFYRRKDGSSLAFAESNVCTFAFGPISSTSRK